MEKEAALEDNPYLAVEEDSMSRETPQCTSSRNSADSTSSSSKRRKRDSSKGNEVSLSSDPFLGMVGELCGDLKNASEHFGKMAAAMEHESKIQEEAVHKDDPMQTLQQKSIAELSRLGFTGTELVKAASVFKCAKLDDHAFCTPETLRREFILNMLADDAQRKK